MKRILKLLVPMIGILLLTSVCAWSGEEQNEAGLHGSMVIGPVIYSGKSSQLAVSDDNERLDHLNQEADSKTVLAPGLLGDLSYRFQRHGTLLTFSTQIDNAGALDYLTGGDAIVLSVTQPLANGSLVSVSVGLGQGEVWKNPYLVGVDRSATDVSIYRISAGFDFQEDRGIYVKGTQLRVCIDDDVIGDRISDLRREGDIYEMEVGYRIKLSDNASLTPSLSYFRKHLDGRSNSANTVLLHLAHDLTIGRFMFCTEAAYGQGKNDHRHPVFDRTLETTQWAFSETVIYTQLFGNPRLSLYALAAYGDNDANINFFDSHGLAVGMGIGYNF